MQRVDDRHLADVPTVVRRILGTRCSNCSILQFYSPVVNLVYVFSLNCDLFVNRAEELAQYVCCLPTVLCVILTNAGVIRYYCFGAVAFRWTSKTCSVFIHCFGTAINFFERLQATVYLKKRGYCWIHWYTFRNFCRRMSRKDWSIKLYMLSYQVWLSYYIVRRFRWLRKIFSSNTVRFHSGSKICCSESSVKRCKNA